MNVADRYEQKWHLPHDIRALDGKHVVIKFPERSGSVYYNYKRTYSIVIMIVVDADYKMHYMNSDCIGRVSDERCSVILLYLLVWSKEHCDFLLRHRYQEGRNPGLMYWWLMSPLHCLNENIPIEKPIN